MRGLPLETIQRLMQTPDLAAKLWRQLDVYFLGDVSIEECSLDVQLVHLKMQRGGNGKQDSECNVLRRGSEHIIIVSPSKLPETFGNNSCLVLLNELLLITFDVEQKVGKVRA